MITLDDKKLEEFGYRALMDHYHEAIPEIRSKTMTIPGMPGRWDFGSELGSKRLEIPIQALSDSSASLQALQNELVAFLMDEFGNPREMNMVFDYEPDKFYTVKIDGAVAPVLRAHILKNMTLPFIAHDPFKYSRLFGDDIVWGSEVVTFEWHYLLGHEGDGASGGFKITSPTTVNVNVDGIAVQPVFEIEGTANNLKIESGKYSFALPNFSDAKWVIDFEKYTVTKNGQDEFIDGINDFYLMPGTNSVKITGNNINLDMRIKFRDKYN